MPAHHQSADAALPSPLSSRTERVEVLTRMRFEERELILPVGVAYLKQDELGRQVVEIQLAILGGRIFLPLWDLLTLAGIDPVGGSPANEERSVALESLA